MGLALATQLAPLGNLGRNMNLNLDLRAGKEKVMMVCHMD